MMAYDQLTKSWPSLENRVLLRAKTNRMILVEGSDDQEFVRNTINSSNDVLVQVCAGKDNVIVKAITCCMRCVLYCLDKYVKFITKNAFI